MHWSPRIGEAVAMAVVGVVLGLATLLVDPAGRVLVGAGAVLLLGLAARDLLLRPRLRADDRGVTVRSLTGGRTIAWPAARARVRTSRRWGLRARTLELEDATDDAVLVVLGRRELGEDPETVARALRAAGAAG